MKLYEGKKHRNICDPFSGAPNYNFTPDLCPKDIIPIEELKYLSYKLQFTQHE